MTNAEAITRLERVQMLANTSDPMTMQRIREMAFREYPNYDPWMHHISDFVRWEMGE